MNTRSTMHPNLLLLALWIRVAIARSSHYFQDDSITTNLKDNNHSPNNIIPEESRRTIDVEDNTEIYNPYNKQHSGRHVCTLQKNSTVPIKTKETYCKPVYQKYVERCHNNQICTGVRLVYETSYKDVVRSKTTQHTTFACCPGWMQVGNRNYGCNRPVCGTKCQNEGICIKPNICKCSKGFTGQFCETDINECLQQKPCDQICHNTHGSFKCQCRENFILQGDGQTCRKEGADSSPGVEAKELEYELLDKRLYKLELMFTTEIPNRLLNSEINKLSTNINDLTKEVNYFKIRLEDMEKYKDHIAHLNYKLEQLEDKTNGGNQLHMKYETPKHYDWSDKLHFT